MTQTITAFFDKRSDAAAAVEQLVQSGLNRADIRILPERDIATSTNYDGAYDVNRDEKGFWASLSDFFFPEDDRYTYAEALNRGSIMVTATVEQNDAAKAIDILEELGTVNLNERETSWRKEGWQGYENTGGSEKGDAIIPLVEEELTIGKRQVRDGHVKVRSYVVESPVSEQVNLRRERVHVERRPVDRAAVVGEDAFRERTIDAQAISEEAIVTKTARIREEVVVSKETDMRIETVTDTVRRTDVEVEDHTGHKARRQSR